MDDRAHDSSTFWIQADALLRKNLTYQKRNVKTNLRLICFPFLLCILLVVTQVLIDNQLNDTSNRCGCSCIDTNRDGTCENVCGLQYSTLDQGSSCLVPYPLHWPPVLQVPDPEYRVVIDSVYTDLPDQSCRVTGTCPVTILVTGNNQTLGEVLAGSMFTSPSPLDS